MSAVAATVLDLTLSEAVDSLLLLAGSGSGGTCIWCGSRRLHLFRSAQHEPTDPGLSTITCRDCGAELTTSRVALNEGRSR